MKLTGDVELGARHPLSWSTLGLRAESDADAKLLERLADWLRDAPAVNLTHLLDLLERETEASHAT